MSAKSSLPNTISDDPLKLELISRDGSNELARISRGASIVIEAPLHIFLSSVSKFVSEFVNSIESVDIGYVKLSSLAFVKDLHSVKQLRIRGTSFVDIKGIANLHLLERLVIDGQVHDMSVIGELESLSTLYLNRWRKGADTIFGLQKLKQVTLGKFPYPSLDKTIFWTQLEDLWINSGNLESVNGIPNSIRNLRLSDLPKFHTISALSNCPDIQKLLIEVCHQFSKLGGLEQAKQLRVLSLSRIGYLTNLEPLRTTSRLEYLFLSDGVKVNPSGVDALYSLTNLQTLIIHESARIDVAKVKEVAPNCDIKITRI